MGVGAVPPGVLRYVLLLRGINVGGHKRVPMAELRALLTGLGHADVRTHLQSGNAVFTAPAQDPGELAAAVEAAIEERFGFAVPCLVLTGEELRAAAARCPFPAAELDPARLAVLFLDRPAASHRLAAEDPAAWAPEEFRLGEREIFAWFPEGMGRSRLGAVLAAPVPGTRTTARNWRTVAALLALLG